ncbi:hypothetical protein [Veillonella intestinalis]|uniref:hypothetical protein n=1 Tax=Veillonella intestinalis TaxID=2941341 RepID=UPI00203E63BD|nr:hypothetical protein [Veillonella intestinalis]
MEQHIEELLPINVIVATEAKEQQSEKEKVWKSKIIKARLAEIYANITFRLADELEKESSIPVYFYKDEVEADVDKEVTGILVEQGYMIDLEENNGEQLLYRVSW